MELLCSECGKEIKEPSSSKTEPCPECGTLLFIPSRQLWNNMSSNSFINSITNNP